MTRKTVLLSVLKRRFFPALLTFSAVIGGSLAYLKVAESSYVAKARLAVDSSNVSVSELGRNLTRLPNNSVASDPIAAQAEMVTSKRILDYAFQYLLSEGSVGPNSSLQGGHDLRESLNVKIVPATNFLDIVLEGEGPELTAKAVNAIAYAMVQFSAEEIRREASSVRLFLDEQIPQQQAELKKIEEYETQFREATGIVDINTQTIRLVNSLSALQDQERELVKLLQAASTQSNLLESVTGFSQPQLAYIATRVGQDKELQELKVAIQKIDEKIAESRSRFTDSQPQVLSLNQERSYIQGLYGERLNQLLAGDLAVDITTASDAKASNPLSQDLISRYILSSIERESLTSQLQVTQRSQQGMQAQLASLPEKRQQLGEIERRRDEVASGLDILQNKLQEAKIAEAQLVSNVSVVDYADFAEEISALPPIAVLFLAIVAGGSLATGMVLLLEMLDRKLHDADEIESETDIPVVGVLPHTLRKALSGDLSNFLDSSSAVEPHRRLLTALELSGDSKPKVLVFTSTRRGEGTSDVIARLGMVAAMLSRRTLIIDADLKEPRQHGIFGTPETPGLTHLADGKVSLDDALYASGFKGLDILPHGAFLQRPSVVTESVRMQHVIEQASQRYDLILINTPPISDCVDATTLSKYSDGIVLTVRPNLTGKDSLAETVVASRKSGLKLTGVVVNGTPALTQITTEDDQLREPLPLLVGEEHDLRFLREGSRSRL